MARLHRLRQILALAAVALGVAAALLWLRSTAPGEVLPDSSSRSPIPSPAGEGTSPLSTPLPSEEEAAAPLARAGAALLWVALGGALTLGVALAILRRQHQGRPQRDA